MRTEMTTERLCRRLNRMLKTEYLCEVLDRREEVFSDEVGVMNPANFYAVGDHAIAYLRWYDEFVPLRRMGSVPQAAWNSYRGLGIDL